MKRRTLDITFALGGALFSVLLLVLGLVLKNQSDFAQSYVKDQLGAQQIYFQPTATLGDEMKTTACLVEYGQGGAADHGGGQLLPPEGERAARVKDFVRRMRYKGPVFEISALTREGCEVLVQEVFKHVHTVHQQLNEPAPVDPRFNEASS